LIPSLAPGQGQGASYAFRDTAAIPAITYCYTLVDVDLSGQQTPHGPVTVALWRIYLPLLY